MIQDWKVVLQILYLLLLLGTSIFLKTRIKLFQKNLIPASMIAGFIGLIISTEVLGLIKFDSEFLGNVIYHLMAIGFIALALKDRKVEKNKDIINTGYFIVNTYIMQAILGLSISLILVNTIFPDLFPNFGLLLPLSFAQGPGQAYSIGSGWEAIGFVNGGNIGLSIATIGFLWALLAGVPFMNLLVKKNKYTIKHVKVNKTKYDDESKNKLEISKKAYLDDFTIQIALIGIVYLITYLFLTFVTMLLFKLGLFAQTLAQLFWGFHFLIGTIFALMFKNIKNKLMKNKNTINYVDNYILQRISNASFDIMITASIAAISLYTLKEYFIPIIILTTAGGIFTMIYTYFMCQKIYDNSKIEHIVGLYGMWTGTITTGIALLKELDPYSKTNVTENLVLGSGVATFLGLPLMMMLNIPIYGYLAGVRSMYILTFILFVSYSILLNLLIYRNKKNKISKKN